MDERSSAIVGESGARSLSRAALGPALQAVRSRTLALFAAYEAALGPGLRVPCTPELNPPLWELGHVGWFADWWIGRNPQRERGLLADPQALRTPARQARRGVDADALYNSSTVAHNARWQLSLPDAQTTREDLAAGLADTLRLLQNARDDDTGLYFFRLALFHECMHAEAAMYMAQTLGFDPCAAGAEVRPAQELASHPASGHTRTLCDTHGNSNSNSNSNSGSGSGSGCNSGNTGNSGSVSSPAQLLLPAQAWTLGWHGPGFAFDNERGPHTVALDTFDIDAAPVSWAHYLPFIESGGYQHAAHWSETGWAWLQQTGATAPRYLRNPHAGTRQSGRLGRHACTNWETRHFGRWQPLDLQAPAGHLSAFEAEAWCRWAGRRLPTEAQWEAAALTQPGFAWGSVWEWTASPFEPFPGFVAHPYQDYSAPWFDGRPVLKGASQATLALMRHAKYRNYFSPQRNDVEAGFRSVGVG